MSEQKSSEQMEPIMIDYQSESKRPADQGSWAVPELIFELTEIKKMVRVIYDHAQNPKVKSQDELWTVNQVAAYLQKSKGTIQSHYQGKPGFPRSKKIGNKRYWKPQEMIEFAKKAKAY